MCYNFLLFPSGFKVFLVAYTLVFFSHFYPTGILEEQYHSLISRTDLIKGECYKIFHWGDLIRFLVFPSVLSPRPQRLRTWGRLPREDRVPNRRFPHDLNMHRGCMRGEFSFPNTAYKYPCDQWIKITRVHFTFSLLLIICTRNKLEPLGFLVLETTSRSLVCLRFWPSFRPWHLHDVSRGIHSPASRLWLVSLAIPRSPLANHFGDHPKSLGILVVRKGLAIYSDTRPRGSSTLGVPQHVPHPWISPMIR
jgi:hypothetical protein